MNKWQKTQAKYERKLKKRLARAEMKRREMLKMLENPKVIKPWWQCLHPLEALLWNGWQPDFTIKTIYHNPKNNAKRNNHQTS